MVLSTVRLLKSICKSLKDIEETFTVLPIREGWASEYAEIRHSLACQGLVVGDLDILIAITARQQDLIVVTHNTRHFSKIPGLMCVDWVDKPITK